jgi:hypothetical protein
MPKQKRRRKRRRVIRFRNKSLKIYAAIICMGAVSALALNIAIDWGSGVLDRMNTIASLGLDAETVEKLKKVLEGDIDDDKDAFAKAERAYANERNQPKLEKAKMKGPGTIDSAKLKKLKKLYKEL